MQTERVVVIAALLRPQGDTGVQTHMRELCAHFDRVGQRWCVVTPFDAPRLLQWPLLGLRRVIERVSADAAVRLYRAGHAWLLGFGLRRALARHRGAVVAAQCPVSAAAALHWRADAGQAVALVVHFNESQADEWIGKGAIMPNGPTSAAIRAFEAKLIGRVDALVFVSAWMRARVAERVPSARDVPQAVIPNFVADPGAPALADSASMRDLIAIGTLEPRKNQGYLLEIIATAARLDHHLTLTIVGDGPDRAALEQQARRLGIADQVHFAGRRVNAARLLTQHRAIIHTALAENLPLVLIEAMAAGRAIFATPAGGTRELFDVGRHGMVLPLDDAASAAALLCAAFDSPGLIEQLGAQGRERFIAHYERSVAGEMLRRLLLTTQRRSDASQAPPSVLANAA